MYKRFPGLPLILLLIVFFACTTEKPSPNGVYVSDFAASGMGGPQIRLELMADHRARLVAEPGKARQSVQRGSWELSSPQVLMVYLVEKEDAFFLDTLTLSLQNQQLILLKQTSRDWQDIILSKK
jgi:hypothetical protein